jgi:spermidine synthase
MACLSCSALVFELTLMRVFSLMFWHHFAYMIISVALLGYGAAGVYWTVHRPSGEQGGTASLPGARAASVFSLLSLASVYLVSKIGFDPLALRSFEQQLKLLLVYALLVLPFFFAGVGVVGLIERLPARIHSLYFFDLVGAGVGCMLAILAIGWVGAVQILIGATSLAAVAGALLSARATRERKLSLVALGLTLLLAALSVWGEPWDVPVAPSKEQTEFLAGGHAVELTRWSALSRLDVLSPQTGPPGPVGLAFSPSLSKGRWEGRIITQDGSAPTYMYRTDGNLDGLTFLDGTTQSFAYQLLPRPRVAVVGPGGGVDVLIALKAGASSITGIEVNPAMIDVVKNRYGDYVGHIFDRPEVRLVEAEGRSFFARSRDTFDVIQFSGVDTYTGLSAGAYVLTESYLYTSQAVDDFVEHLSPTGILSMSRWAFAPPRETLRLCITMVDSLRRRGVAEPEKHIAVFGGSGWATALLKRDGFTPGQLETLRAFAERMGFATLYDPYRRRDSPYDTMLRAPIAELHTLFDSYPYDVRPVGDDRPFFFHYYKWSTFLKKVQVSTGGFGKIQNPPFPIGHAVLLLSLLQIVALASVLILVPLFRARRLGLARREAVRTLAYFAAIGLGYMFFEIVLIQKLVVFLGSPARSISVTLATLLIASGLGSRLSERLRPEPRTLRAMGLVAVSLFTALALGSSPMLRLFLGQPDVVRAALAVLMICPMGVLLGSFFPLGIRRAASISPKLVPWCCGVNSFFSVFASMLAVLLGMEGGFTSVLLLAGAVYLLGAVGFTRLARSSHSASASQAACR